MKLKRLALLSIAVCLACLLLLSARTHAAAITQSGTCGSNLTWTLDVEGTLTISGSGAMTGYAAKGAPWYTKRAGIKTIVMEAGVTTIGNNAFYDCTAAADVSIPAGVTSIGDQAFYNCAGLTQVVLPQALTNLGTHAFYKCTKLTSVNLPDGLPKLNHNTFYGCTSLAEITLPEGITSIGGYAFFNCSALETLVIPTSVTMILSDAFSGCANLREVTIPKTVQDLGTRVFNRCNQLQDIYYGGSFVDWLSLPAANRPKATYIHYACTTSANHWFEDSKAASCIAAGYERMACGCGYTKDETVIPVAHSYLNQVCSLCGAPEGLAFTVNNWSGGSEVTITGYTGTATALTVPATIGGYPVTEIGASAFENCENLAAVTLADSIETIRDRALRNCAALAQINIPASTVSIGYEAFYGCGQLSIVIIPESITEIGGQAFTGCDKISEIYYGGTADNWKRLYNTPSAPYVHYGCTAPEGHWVTGPVDATCETGSALCTRCSCGYAEYDYLSDPLGHKEVIDPAVEASCASAGKTEGKHCDRCQAVLVAQQTIPALSHTYDDGLDGTCNNCGIHREETEDRTVMHMFRMYDPNSGEHFYTGSVEEREMLVAAGWNYEGVGFTFSRTTGLPVYRLYDPISGEHLYTMEAPVKTGQQYEGKDLYECEGRIWLYEGIAFNSAYDTEVPQYRLRNPNATRGAYHFTSSAEERDNLIAAGWISEGICFYSSWK